MNENAAEAPGATRRWWLDILINVAPLAIFLAYENYDELRDLARRAFDYVFPPSADANPHRLAWMRRRAEAGGYDDDMTAAAAEEAEAEERA